MWSEGGRLERDRMKRLERDQIGPAGAKGTVGEGGWHRAADESLFPWEGTGG